MSPKSILSDRSRPLVIAGPCSAETREQTLSTCLALAETGLVDVLRAGIWKPRTSPGSFSGVGEEALGWLAEARSLTGLPVAVEVATARHVESAVSSRSRGAVDLIWIGARTTVSPFAVQEIAEALRGTDVPVLVKNPLNPDVELWAGAVERLLAAGVTPGRIGLIHRGFSYLGRGRYRNAPAWPLAFEMRDRFPVLPMICDPSHMGGDRKYISELAQSAADLRYDGLMIESHICPDRALSDPAQQLSPADLASVLRGLNWRAEAADDPEFVRSLAMFREEIDQIDTELLGLLGRRMRISEQIGAIKRSNNVAILQNSRWAEIRARLLSQAAQLGLSPEFLSQILNAIHLESIARQQRD